MFNSHVHTCFSPDCSSSPEELCDAAVKRNMIGICFTDHCSLDSYILDNAYRSILASSSAAKKMGEKYGEDLVVLSGVELSEVMRKPDYAARLLKNIKLDSVLLSVHTAIIKNKPVYFSKINFSAMDTNEIRSILKAYFRDMLDSVNKCDFDILAHLTHPFFFVNGEHKKNISASEFYEDIEKIFSFIIKNNKALEINTSKLNSSFNDFMPDEELIRLYCQMGGRLITLGSDAHSPETIDFGFDEAKALLKSIGFSTYSYFEKRKIRNISLY